MACLGRSSDQQPAATRDDWAKMAQNRGILARLTTFWTPKFYSWGATAPFRAIRPALEAYWAGKHTGKRSKAIATSILRGQPRLGSKMLPGTPCGPTRQNTVFDIPRAPMVRFGPFKARSNQNYPYNTVQSDVVGPHTVEAKRWHFGVFGQSQDGAQFGPF